jgi:hypothetical protein
MTFLDSVVAVKKLGVTVPDSVMKSVVVNTVSDSFVTVLVLVVKK